VGADVGRQRTQAHPGDGFHNGLPARRGRWRAIRSRSCSSGG
jgi:hypothetical protein